MSRKKSNGFVDSIGQAFGGWFGESSSKDPPQPPPAAAAAAGVPTSPRRPSSPQGATATIYRHPEQVVATSTMTREELKARRIARVESATNLIESPHVKVMLRFLDGVCLIGPFWILVFTTSEVGQMFTGKAFDLGNQTSVNVYAAALFGECILAGLTFIWQYADAYTRSLDAASAERASMDRWVRGLGFTWLFFAAISALGQFIYLRGVWLPKDIWGYTLIVGRVTIYTLGDWACAKYLGWRVTTLRKIAQEEKAKGEIYAEMERQEAHRIECEAEADLHLRQIHIQIMSQERNAKIANDVQEIMSQASVKFLGQFTTAVDVVMNNVLHNVNQRLQLPAVDAQAEAIEAASEEE